MTRPARSPVTAAAVMVLLTAALASGCGEMTIPLDDPPTSTAPAERRPGDVSVTASGEAWIPDRLEVSTGSVALFVTNRDEFAHTFTSEVLDVDEPLPAKSNARVEVDVEPGSYAFRCTVPGHEDMTGRLLVRPG